MTQTRKQYNKNVRDLTPLAHRPPIDAEWRVAAALWQRPVQQKKQKAQLILASLLLLTLIACNEGGGSGGGTTPIDTTLTDTTPTDTTPTDTIPTEEIGAPQLSNVTLGTLTETTAQVIFDLADSNAEAGQQVAVHWAAIAATDNPPNRQQVIAGQSADGTTITLKGSSDHIPGTERFITVGENGTTLDKTTAYTIYLVAVDADNNNSGDPLPSPQVPALPATVLSNLRASITESSPKDTQVIDLSVELSDIIGSDYSIRTGDDTNKKFAINASSGVVTTTAIPLDYEAMTAYDLTISLTASNDRGRADTMLTLAVAVLDQGADSDGDGLIEISTRAQLNAIRYDLDGNGSADSAGYQTIYAAAGWEETPVCLTGTACRGYELTADIDLAGSSTNQWHPIGNCGTNGNCLESSSNDDNAFTGILEGNGHTIRNIYIRGITETPDDRLDALGLFGLLDGATIRNLKIAEVDIVATYNAASPSDIGDENSIGTLAAAVTGNSAVIAVTVTDSDDNPDLQGANRGDNQYVGGLTGRILGTTVIRASSTDVMVTGGNGSKDNVGGLTGGQSTSSSIIIASYASGTVTDQAGDDDSVGGLVGLQDGGSIVASYASGTVIDRAGKSDNVGGLVGWQLFSAIVASYASGAVTDELGETDTIGGLVGWQLAGTIVASYANGNVNDQAGENDHIGGLVGHQQNSAIVASYASGDANSTIRSLAVGKLIGSRISSTHVDSYGFGSATGTPEAINTSGDPPSGVTTAEGLSSDNTGSSWKSAVWAFGNILDPQPPALKYVDGYDGNGPNNIAGDFDDHAYSCDPAFFSPIGVVCNITLLPR